MALIVLLVITNGRLAMIACIGGFVYWIYTRNHTNSESSKTLNENMNDKESIPDENDTIVCPNNTCHERQNVNSTGNSTLGLELQKANDGDVEAMLALSDYYMSQKKVDEATEWADKAAATCDPNAVYNAAILHDRKLQVFMKGGTEFWGPIREDAVAAKNNAMILLNFCKEGLVELEEDEKSRLERILRDATYAEAITYYLGYQKDYQKVIELLKKAEGARELVLSGLAYIKLNQTEEAKKKLVAIENISDYSSSVMWPKEQELYNEAISIKSSFTVQ